MNLDALLAANQALRDELRGLHFGPPVGYVYNPLEYAWDAWELYLRRFARPDVVVLLGMNPGPFGMAQTGVPFGDVETVRDWLRIEARIGRPAREHPKRPVEGFAWKRREVSGQRLWGWARQRFAEPEAFFERFFVFNYCPLLFLETSGRNLTPDKLERSERLALFEACDRGLSASIVALSPRAVVGVGNFASERARLSLDGLGLLLGRVPHPSPQNPAANAGWSAAFERDLKSQNLLD